MPAFPCASPSSPTSTATGTPSRRCSRDVAATDVRELWCLGDLVGYGADPDDCCALAREHAAVCLAGNHDLAVTGDAPARRVLPRRRARRALDAGGHRPTTRRLPARRSSPQGDARGRRPLPRQPARPGLGVRAQHAAGRAVPRRRGRAGRPRRPLARRAVVRPPRGRGGDRRAAPRRATTLDLATGEWLLNPGSVGQPRDGDPRAAWLLLDTDDLDRAQWQRTEYDIAGARRRSAPPACRTRSPSGSGTVSEDARRRSRTSWPPLLGVAAAALAACGGRRPQRRSSRRAAPTASRSALADVSTAVDAGDCDAPPSRPSRAAAAAVVEPAATRSTTACASAPARAARQPAADRRRTQCQTQTTTSTRRPPRRRRRPRPTTTPTDTTPTDTTPTDTTPTDTTPTDDDADDHDDDPGPRPTTTPPGDRRHHRRDDGALMADARSSPGATSSGDRLGVGGMSTVHRGLRPPPRAPRRRQAAGRAPRRRPAVRRALPPRGARRRAARAPEHRAGLRLRPRRAQRPPLHRHGARRAASPARRSCASAGMLGVEEALSIVAQACRGLDYAHRNGVVHRDVKPGNLLRSEDGVVKLADFGIAKAAERRVGDHPGRLGARHRRLPRARAGARRGGRPARGPLRARRRHLPAALRPPALRGAVADRARAKQQREVPPPLDELNPDVPPAARGGGRPRAGARPARPLPPTPRACATR